MRKSIIRKVWDFYFTGFRNIPQWGKQVWIIIIIKLFIMFAVLKLFFFPDFLNSKFESEQEKADYVLEQLTK